MDLNKLENDINKKEKVKPMVGLSLGSFIVCRIFCNNCKTFRWKLHRRF